MSNLPKYARLEIERRWLVDRAKVGRLDAVPFRTIDDLYIEATHLRLRRVVEPSGEIVFKLGKKYGKHTQIAEAITTLYLTEAEYTRFASLSGHRVSKRRFVMPAGGSLDLYPPPHDAIAIFELEFASEEAAAAYRPPPFVAREVTGDPEFSGYELARRR